MNEESTSLQECEGCGKNVPAVDLKKDFMEEMSCSGCRAVHEHVNAIQNKSAKQAKTKEEYFADYHKVGSAMSDIDELAEQYAPGEIEKTRIILKNVLDHICSHINHQVQSNLPVDDIAWIIAKGKDIEISN